MRWMKKNWYEKKMMTLFFLLITYYVIFIVSFVFVCVRARDREVNSVATK